MRIEANADSAVKRFFLKKEAKTFVHWRARCRSARIL
jgi:hypothetical protein